MRLGPSHIRQYTAIARGSSVQAYRIAQEGGTPSCEDAPDSLGAANLPPSLKVTFVQLRIDLPTAFYEIHWRHRRMCRTLARRRAHLQFAPSLSSTMRGIPTHAKSPPNVHAA